MAKSQPANRKVDELRAASQELAGAVSSLTPKAARTAHAELSTIVEQLQRLLVELDPIREPTHIFDPADPGIVGSFVGVGLVAQEKCRLDSVQRMYGSGVYALYYDGPFGLYAPLVGSETPIYVGKADPADRNARSPRQQGQKLSGRLREHARSIGKATSTLAIEDFTCRYLVVRGGWQEAAESYLIELFKPIWNDETRICYGFGKHGDDPATRANLRSPWDTVHVGRAWAHRDPSMRDARSLEQIEAEVASHFALHPPFRSADEIMRRFYEGLRQL